MNKAKRNLMLCWDLWEEIDKAGISEEAANDRMQEELEKAHKGGVTDIWEREFTAATAFLSELRGEA